ncbi:hypothetical protein [Sulfuricurvum sp.]|uniref:hypothetical protein n=1 Tax=Sulfuricurvum sp. TaxID=2025608 RepID=UPI003565C40C
MSHPINSRLPHKEPIVFIGELIKLDEIRCRFWTQFPSVPTLSMFCEAAAQGSSFFPLSPECTIGVVSSFRNVKKLDAIDATRYSLSIQIKHTFNNSYLFNFEALDPNTELVVATGEIAIFYLAP